MTLQKRIAFLFGDTIIEPRQIDDGTAVRPIANEPRLVSADNPEPQGLLGDFVKFDVGGDAHSDGRRRSVRKQAFSSGDSEAVIAPPPGAGR